MRKLEDLLAIVRELEIGEPFCRGLSWLDVAILNWIERSGSSTVGDVAARFAMLEYSASRKISRLIAKGLAIKDRVLADKRSTQVRVSPEGKKCLALVESRFQGLLFRARYRHVFPSHDFASIALPACECSPVWSDGALDDLEIVIVNDALVDFFPDARILRRIPLLSRYESNCFGSIISAFSRVACSGEPGSLELAGGSGFAKSLWRITRLDSGNLRCVFDNRESGAPRVAPGDETDDPQPLHKKLFDTGPITLIINTETEMILDANRAAERFYGWKRDDFIKKKLSDISLSSPEKIAGGFREIRESGAGILHVTHRLANGDIRNLEVRVSMGILESTPVHVSIVIDQSLKRPSGNSSGSDPGEDPGGKISIAEFASFIETHRERMPCLKELLTDMLPYGRILKYSAGDHFMELGENRIATGFILSGVFRKYTLTPDGKDYTLSLFRSGDVITPEFFRGLGSTNPFALEARDECTVFVIPDRCLIPLMNEDPRWYKFLYLDQSAKVAKANARELSLLHDDANERYGWFLKHDSASLSCLRNYHIAAYLGITSETLSRIRKKNGKIDIYQ